MRKTEGRDPYLYTIKDIHNYSLINNVESQFGTIFHFKINKCNNSTSEVTCADFGPNDEKLNNYLHSATFIAFSALNYVDYNNVEPFIGPVVRTLQYMTESHLVAGTVDR